MGVYFLDTSAIVKRYDAEQGQALVLDICDPEHGHDIYISQAALVEVVSAFCRRAHERNITADECDRLINLFRQHIRDEYVTIPVTTDIYTAAGDLCRLEKLLADTSIGTSIVENRDRLTRFGSHYIETLLEAQGRHIEMIFQSDTGSPFRSADRQVDAEASLQNGKSRDARKAATIEASPDAR